MTHRLEKPARARNSLAIGLVVVAGGAIPFELANRMLPHVQGLPERGQVLPEIHHLPAAGTASYADIATNEMVGPTHRIQQDGLRLYREV